MLLCLKVTKYLLVLLLLCPVWVEKRTANNKVTPRTYGPVNKFGAIYAENGTSINLVDFTKQGSWINIRSASGLDTNFLWGDNGKIEIYNIQNIEGLYLQVDLSVFSGTCSLSSTNGLWFVAGDGTEDQTMTFRGNLESINLALENVQYNSITQDPTNKNITGCLFINVDKYDNQPPTIIMESQ